MSAAVRKIGTGTPVFEHGTVEGTYRLLAGPDDVLELMDRPEGAAGIVAGVRDAGATFLAPLYHELAGILCAGGTPASHIGIMSREFQVPCLMGTTYDGDEPGDGTAVRLEGDGVFADG